MSSSTKRSIKKVASKKPIATNTSVASYDQRPHNLFQSPRPMYEHGYPPDQYPYHHSYSQPHLTPPPPPRYPPEQPPYHHSTAPQTHYQQRTSYGAYDDHSSYMSLMMQNDQRHQQHLNAKQLEIRDREAMQNLSMHCSAQKDPTTEEISSGSDKEENEDQEDETEDSQGGNEEIDAEMNEDLSQQHNTTKKKWKSLSGIFSNHYRGSTSDNVDVGIEDINVDNAEDETIATDGRKRQVKFTVDQYFSLAKAWIRISQDSITGNNMKGQKFWEKVADYYNSIEPLQRTWGSLRGGYRVMNAACQNYMAILTRLENRQRSGVAPYDVIEEARKEFQQKYGNPFKFQKCYELLSELPKWKNPNSSVFEQQNKARRMNYEDSSPGSDPSSQERSPLFGSSDARPVGRNKSIQLEQRSAEFSRFMGTLETTNKEAREHRINFAAERNRSETEFRKSMAEDRELRRREQEDKKALAREKNYIKLMTCDFSKLSPLQQQLVTEQLQNYKNMQDSSSGFGSESG